MAYRRFDLAKIERGPAKVAKVANNQSEPPETFAKFATFAGVEPKTEKPEEARAFDRDERLAVYGEVEDDAVHERWKVGQEGRPKTLPGGNSSAMVEGRNISGGTPTISQRPEEAAHAGRFEDRPANWMPEPGPGVTILRPAAELPAIEYDMHLDRLISALPAGSAEAQRLVFAKRKGWVVECEGRRIFTRGRF